MKNIILLFLIVATLSCKNNYSKKVVTVEDKIQLESAISEAQAGTSIIMKNGTWSDVEIAFVANGTIDNPITLSAETPGKVFIEGRSSLHLGGTYLHVEGLHFRNGYSPSGGVIRYQVGEDNPAFHSRVTNCVIEDFSRPNRWEGDRWIEFYGQYNQLDHCYISGKSNDGATLMVYFKGRQHMNNHHQIVNNYFGPRPRKGVNVPIGEGMVDFDKYFKLLKKYRLNPPVSLHLEYPLGGAEKGKKNITLSHEQVYTAMGKDLKAIQELWNNA